MKKVEKNTNVAFKIPCITKAVFSHLCKRVCISLLTSLSLKQPLGKINYRITQLASLEMILEIIKPSL